MNDHSPGKWETRLSSVTGFLTGIGGILAALAAILTASVTLTGVFLTRGDGGNTDGETTVATSTFEDTTTDENVPTESQHSQTGPADSGGPAQFSFRIKVGDTVEAGRPGEGAGEIETPGSSDRYTFSARAGDRVFFDALPLGDACGSGGTIKWKLAAANSETPAFDTLLQSSGYCYDKGPVDLDRGGNWVLTVYGSEDKVGRYRFRPRRA